MKVFFQKNWSNLLFVMFFILILVPQTRMTIQVFFQRLISFSPSETSIDGQLLLEDYNWSVTKLDGATANLKYNEGNVVLINKWATWCPPCVAEMPSLQKLYDSYGERVFFYFISDESPEKLQEFMFKNSYDFPVYMSRSLAPERLNSNALPTSYVISKDKKIIMEKVGAANWNSEVVHNTLDRLLQ